MPHRPPTPCAHPGCPHVSRERYCPQHAAAYQQAERQRLAARPSAAQRGYGRAWQRARGEWLAAHPECVACGSAASLVDHRVPLSAGGPDHPSNFQSMCQPCHASKTKRESDARRAVSA